MRVTESTQVSDLEIEPGRLIHLLANRVRKAVAAEVTHPRVLRADAGLPRRR